MHIDLSWLTRSSPVGTRVSHEVFGKKMSPWQINRQQVRRMRNQLALPPMWEIGNSIFPNPIGSSLFSNHLNCDKSIRLRFLSNFCLNGVWVCIVWSYNKTRQISPNCQHPKLWNGKGVVVSLLAFELPKTLCLNSGAYLPCGIFQQTRSTCKAAPGRSSAKSWTWCGICSLRGSRCR